MKQLLLFGTLTLAAIALLIACGGSNTNVNVNANHNANNANSGSTMGNAVNSVSNAVSSVMTASPEDFMKAAAQGGMAEVKMGQLAAKNAKDPEVKKFGQMMVTDHTAAGKDLEAVAKKKNFTLPTDIGSHQSTYDKLSKLTGADFDKEYVDEMVDDHEADLKDFQRQADNSTDPDVKAFAQKVVPVIQKHLDAIKAIQAKMNGSGSNTGTANSNTKK